MALGAGMLKGGKERRMARRAARQEAKAQGKGLLAEWQQEQQQELV